MHKSIKRSFEELKEGGLLPSPQGLALAILDVSHRPDANLNDVARLVQADPAMSGRLLRYANSAQTAATRHIVSLGQAITFLGLFRVRQIVLAFSLLDRYRSGKCAAFDYPEYWTTSVATAIAAQKMAEYAQCPPDDSFTCGLLSNIGRLGLATAFPEDYDALLRQELPPEKMIAAERDAFGIDHSFLSKEMLVDWGVPAIFAQAVQFHEQPMASPFAPESRAYILSSSLHFAMRVGQLLNLDHADRWQQVPLLFHSAAQFGMDEGDVPTLVESVANSWQTWTQELSLTSKSYSDLRQLLTAPPTAPDQAPDPVRSQLMRVALITTDIVLRDKVTEALGMARYPFQAMSGVDEFALRYSDNWPEVVIIDVGGSPGCQTNPLHDLKHIADPGLQILVLIPSACESEVARLLAAGATDYLVYEFTQSALIARLINIQRLVALQDVVRAERELAVQSSGQWARANRRLIHNALTDLLTQLPNRRYGMDRFEQEWSVSSSNSLPISCLMLDIDNFKDVNDQYGHEVGDLVLRQVAFTIERCCRRSDFIFRYGGEEFCCICPETDLTEATRLAERIVWAIREEKVGREGEMFGLTLSIGVATRSPEMTELAQLISAADKALYAAKKAGRDRVSAFGLRNESGH